MLRSPMIFPHGMAGYRSRVTGDPAGSLVDYLEMVDHPDLDQFIAEEPFFPAAGVPFDLFQRFTDVSEA